MMLVLLLAGSVLAQSVPVGEQFSYKQDKHFVYEFFSFFCPHCRKADPIITHWGQTLPRPLSFQPVPVVTESTPSIQLARAYYAAWYTDPAKRDLCKTQLFALAAQGDRRDLAQSQTYFKLAAQLGIDGKTFTRWWNSTEVKADLLRAHALLQAYRVASTPSLAICGRSLITPDITRGNYRMFLTLANGIISKVLVADGKLTPPSTKQ